MRLRILCGLVAFGALCRCARHVPEPLFNGSEVVKAGAIYYIHFTVGGPARVSGRIEASGGSGNDIQAVLATADEFQNWENGHQARVLFQTDKTTVATIDVPISKAGTYYLGFSNRFSTLTDKTITGNVVLYH